MGRADCGYRKACIQTIPIGRRLRRSDAFWPMGEKPGTWDYNAVRYGDLLTLLVDNEGFLALPAFEEPLPQAEQAASHVRAARVGEDGALPQHFMTRCVCRCRLCALCAEKAVFRHWGLEADWIGAWLWE